MDEDKPTELTCANIDKFMEGLLNGDYDPKKRPCWTCSKEFFPNYNDMECDECWFSRFSKEEVKAFYQTFLD